MINKYEENILKFIHELSSKDDGYEMLSILLRPIKYYVIERYSNHIYELHWISPTGWMNVSSYGHTKEEVDLKFKETLRNTAQSFLSSYCDMVYDDKSVLLPYMIKVLIDVDLYDDIIVKE